MDQRLRRTVTSTFKLSGFSLQSEAATYLVGILNPIAEQERSVWLDKIIDKVQKQPLKNTLITKDIIEQASKECGKGEQHDECDIIQLINAFNFPKFLYNVERKKFIVDTSSDKLALAGGSEKPTMYQRRYSVLLQRTLHHELFTPSIQGVEWETEKRTFNLRTVEFLMAHTSKVSDIIVLGMITQLKEGKYYLEDPTGAVQMDVSAARYQAGLFTESCFVLAEGYYDDGIFHVSAIGLPPPEEAKITRTYHGGTNFFGATSSLNNNRLLQIEAENGGSMFIFLSEVHLDNVIVLEKLKVLFRGYEEAPPLAFVFLGNFLSEPHGGQSSLVLRDAFKNLADIIAEFPALVRESKFVIVPGTGDPGFVNILPRPPFPEVITEYFREKIPSAVFMSNPCRIKYCTKEIVVFREDVMAKMCRNSIFFPSTGSISKHFVQTLTGQAHLCPLPLHVCPIYWSYDHALHLYPIPDLVVIGDRCDPFIEEQLGGNFVNPGSFVKTNFSFKAYNPYENKVEDCQLPEEQQ